MQEFGPPSRHENEPRINWLEVVRRLKESGIDIEYDDFLGEDDNDRIGNLTTIALEYGYEPEDFFEIAGIPVDKMDIDE